MRLLSLRLKNIAQHAMLNWEFEPGLIGIFGPNGSGKSNAINGGAYAALTNDFSRMVGGKEGVIRQQIPKEEVAEVFTRWEHQGEEFSIRRTIQPGLRHEMLFRGKSYKRAGEIEEQLHDALGIGRRLIDEYIFVHQDALRAFLSSTASVRAKSFARLCNTLHAEKCYEALGAQIEVDRSLAGEIADTSDDIRGQIGQYKLRLSKLRKQKEAEKARRLSGDKKVKAEALIGKRQLYVQLAEVRDKTRRDCETFLADARAAVKLRKAAEQALIDSKTRYEKAAAEAERAQKTVAAYDEQKHKWIVLQQRGRELTAIQKRRPVLPEKPTAASPLSELRNEQGGLLSEKIKLDHWIANTLTETGEIVAECDACGSSLTGKAARDRLVKARETIPVLAKDIQEYQVLIDKLDRYAEDMAGYRRGKAVYDTMVENARKILSECEEAAEPADIDREALMEIGQKTDNLLLEIQGEQGLERRLQDARAGEARMKGWHQASKKQLVAVVEDLEKNEVSDEVFKTSRSVLTRHETAEIEIVGIDARIDECVNFVKEKRAELRRITQLLSRSEEAREWVVLMEAMRKILHRDNLPRIVHHHALLRMQGGINDTLARFDDPFHITAEPDLRLIARFPDGTVMPGEGLSVGQQDILALAFRWTLNSLFASQVGMLVLDEPTAGLDERNIDLLERALGGLGDMAKARGYQVIIITHERRLENVFDQVLVLEKAT